MPLRFLRHTQPDIGNGICYGQLDVDVAANFQTDAAKAYAALPQKPARILSSPLQRCRKLASFISQKTAAPVTIDNRLKEIDFGAWEGAAWDAIDRSEIDAWAADFAYARPHGGESVAMLKARVDNWLDALEDRETETLVVTHAGVIRAASAQSLTPESFDLSIAFGASLAWRPPGLLRERK